MPDRAVSRPNRLRILIVGVFVLAVYHLLAWLPDHDISDAHAWALGLCVLLFTVGVYWPARRSSEETP